MKIEKPEFKIQNSKKGVSIYLAVMIMFILLAIGLGMSVIIVSQIKMIREMGHSVIAFYAADTGIEKVLYKDEECRRSAPNCDLLICEADCSRLSDQTFPEEAIGGASYIVTVSNNATSFESVGIYKETKRAIETTR
ncbi:pilus assembly PilX N-terminal domain-containing protein [Patescibacteria group bacterium]|nr:pilus assembly PilX N-terminal domain-containing protein [Patescibacteria group bacterium]